MDSIRDSINLKFLFDHKINHQNYTILSSLAVKVKDYASQFFTAVRPFAPIVLRAVPYVLVAGACLLIAYVAYRYLFKKETNVTPPAPNPLQVVPYKGPRLPKLEILLPYFRANAPSSIQNFRANAPSSIEKPLALPPTPFDAYVSKHHGMGFAHQANGLADYGDKLLKLVLHHPEGIANDPTEKELSAISWALMRRAIKKGEGFVEGTFSVEDPEGRLYNYFSSAGGYYRTSSHLPERARKIPLFKYLPFQLPRFTCLQHGVDIKKHPLPANHRTLLFAQIDAGMKTQSFFLKPEPNGTDVTSVDFWLHMYDYLASLKRVLIPHSNEQEGMKKERVPTEAMRLFANMLDHFEIQNLEDSFRKLEASAFITPMPFQQDATDLTIDTRESRKNIHMQIAMNYGIQYMQLFALMLRNREKQPDGPLLDALRNLENYLSQFKETRWRTGNEVCYQARDFLLVH